jgi:hypothetical protein
MINRMPTLTSVESDMAWPPERFPKAVIENGALSPRMRETIGHCIGV